MKCKEVLQALNISRPTLSKYVKTGLVKVKGNINGHYVYDDESVNKLLYNTEYDDHSLSQDNTSTTIEGKPFSIDKPEDLVVKDGEFATIAIDLGAYNGRIMTRDEMNIESLCDCMSDVVQIFQQLGQMKLLTPTSINKLKNIKESISEISDSYKKEH